MNNEPEFVDAILVCVDCGKCYDVYSKDEGIPLMPDERPTCECGCTTFEVVPA